MGLDSHVRRSVTAEVNHHTFFSPGPDGTEQPASRSYLYDIN